MEYNACSFEFNIQFASLLGSGSTPWQKLVKQEKMATGSSFGRRPACLPRAHALLFESMSTKKMRWSQTKTTAKEVGRKANYKQLQQTNFEPNTQTNLVLALRHHIVNCTSNRIASICSVKSAKEKECFNISNQIQN